MAKQTVLVTGAEGALGGFVAKRFLAGGYRVVGTHHPAGRPGSEPGVQWLAMSLADPASVREGLKAAGDVDALAHCAGGFRYAELGATSDEDFNFLVDANLRSTFFLLRELLPSMKKRNHGRIVLVSARATQQPPAGMSAYCATKAAINALVASAADEARPFDININAVMPTIIDTPANRASMPKADFSTWVAPEALAEIIFSLTQPVGKPVNGALIPVAGRL
jgi:NAD(P)-dependent dehydrogenase (short-subunit alcohol dehydrogenase family)